jgi:hypothetical protein
LQGFFNGQPEIKAETGRPAANYVYRKEAVGEDVQNKIAYLQGECYKVGMTQEQIHWTLALVDHESAGTWSETVKGDYGNSTGIAQWHKPSGRIAPATFEAQATLICTEMKSKYDLFSIETAVGKHNAPAWKSNPKYINKVRKALKFFK